VISNICGDIVSEFDLGNGLRSLFISLCTVTLNTGFCAAVFLRATARSAKRVPVIVILSVRRSVRLLRPGTDSSPCKIETPGFHHYDSAESLVSCEQLSCPWLRRFPSNEGIKEGYP